MICSFAVLCCYVIVQVRRVFRPCFPPSPSHQVIHSLLLSNTGPKHDDSLPPPSLALGSKATRRGGSSSSSLDKLNTGSHGCWERITGKQQRLSGSCMVSAAVMCSVCFGVCLPRNKRVSWLLGAHHSFIHSFIYCNADAVCSGSMEHHSKFRQAGGYVREPVDVFCRPAHFDR